MASLIDGFCFVCVIIQCQYTHVKSDQSGSSPELDLKRATYRLQVKHINSSSAVSLSSRPVRPSTQRHCSRIAHREEQEQEQGQQKLRANALLKQRVLCENHPAIIAARAFRAAKISFASLV
jgi:hypothetical protein